MNRQSAFASIGLALLSCGVVGGNARAQSCVQSTHHWALTSQYFYEVFDFFCGPSIGNSFEFLACHQHMTALFSNAPPAVSAANNVILAALDLKFESRVGGAVHYTRSAGLPLACVVPAGGTKENNGRLHPVHSPRYNAANPAQYVPSNSYLRANTSMCFGEGDDTITLAQGSFSCGGITVFPINYDGYQFLTYGEGGRDVVLGGGGSDWIYGGSGDDNITARNGADYISGDTENDVLYGNAGDDFIVGGSGRDWLLDSGGSLDVHMGNAGDDCFTDDDSQAIYGHDGTDIANASTRAGATSIVSVEANSGWCVPE